MTSSACSHPIGEFNTKHRECIMYGSNHGMINKISKKAFKPFDRYQSLCLSVFMLGAQKVHAAANIIGQDINDEINEASGQNVGTIIERLTQSLENAPALALGISFFIGVVLVIYGIYSWYMNSKEGEQNRGRKWGGILIAGVLLTSVPLVIAAVRGSIFQAN